MARCFRSRQGITKVSAIFSHRRRGSPAPIASADLAALGMPGARALAVTSLARSIAADPLLFSRGAGLVANFQKNWEFRVQGTNLTNQIGLTEGNARFIGKTIGIGNVILARPIEGQEINFEAKYKF